METEMILPESESAPVEIDLSLERPATDPAVEAPTVLTSGGASPATVAGPTPQSCGGGVPSAVGAIAPVIYVYAIGKIRVTYPSNSVRREFDQANWIQGPPGTATQFIILSQPRNAYIAGEMCWILQIDAGEVLGPDEHVVDSFVDAYILKPRTSVELNDLVMALQPAPVGGQEPIGENILYTLVIGNQGGLAPADTCHGLQLPIVGANNVESFRRDEFVLTIQFEAKTQTVEQASFLLDLMLQLAGNTGNTDEYRAVNFLVLNSFNAYRMLATMYGYATDTKSPYLVPGNYAFTHLSTRTNGGDALRRIVDVIFHFQELDTGEAINWFCQVDVTELFPFIVRQFSKYYTNP